MSIAPADLEDDANTAESARALSASTAKRARLRLAFVRTMLFVLIVGLGSPLTAYGVWIIREQMLRQKLIAQGLPATAAVDRRLAYYRDEYRRPDGTWNDTAFQGLAYQLQSCVRHWKLNGRTVSIDEIFFYLGPPELVHYGQFSFQYLYNSNASKDYRIEVQVMTEVDAPHNVLMIEVRTFSPKTTSRDPNQQPFPRKDFVPYISTQNSVIAPSTQPPTTPQIEK